MEYKAVINSQNAGVTDDYTIEVRHVRDDCTRKLKVIMTFSGFDKLPVTLLKQDFNIVYKREKKQEEIYLVGNDKKEYRIGNTRTVRCISYKDA